MPDIFTKTTGAADNMALEHTAMRRSGALADLPDIDGKYEQVIHELTGFESKMAAAFATGEYTDAGLVRRRKQLAEPLDAMADSFEREAMRLSQAAETDVDQQVARFLSRPQGRSDADDLAILQHAWTQLRTLDVVVRRELIRQAVLTDEGRDLARAAFDVRLNPPVSLTRGLTEGWAVLPPAGADDVMGTLRQRFGSTGGDAWRMTHLRSLAAVLRRTIAGGSDALLPSGPIVGSDRISALARTGSVD